MCLTIFNCFPDNPSELSGAQFRGGGFQIYFHNYKGKEYPPQKYIFLYGIKGVPLYYALAPNGGVINKLPLIKLQEVFAPARPTLIQTIQRYDIPTTWQNKVVHIFIIMAAQPQMTPEELYDNYEYKVTKRMLLREFPWIKDVTVREDEINKYNIIFLDIKYNPYELQKVTGWPLMWYAPRMLDDEGGYLSPYMSTIFNVPVATTRDITEELETLARTIHNSPAIPKDMKMPLGRVFGIGSYRAIGPPPEGYEPIISEYQSTIR